MSKNQFDIGDVVRLKSGSPKMTVAKLSTDKEKVEYQCQWFNFDTKKMEQAYFYPAMLEPDSSKKSDDIEKQD
jgi:uncharacterized protein YodC (DUF2158 family)